jgi:hypothetical protein
MAVTVAPASATPSSLVTNPLIDAVVTPCPKAGLTIMPRAHAATRNRTRRRGVTAIIAGLSVCRWDSNEPKGGSWNGSHADVIVAITVRASDSRSRA